ncbi:hypothetical protein Tco_0393551 [Tanacetum coccineum]
MHNNIMAAGSRDRPPMRATRRYAQWQSSFMRYVDIKPNSVALKKCILQGPYVLSEIIIPGQPTTYDFLAVPARTVPKTFLNISTKNQAHFDAEAEAIHLILTGIGDDIYLTIDACTTAKDIERLQQTESFNKQDYQKEVKEIRDEKIARNANPLALVTTAQQYPDTYYQAPKSHKSYAPPSKQSSSTRSHATTRHKGKEIAKPITPLSESAFEEDNDLEQA